MKKNTKKILAFSVLGLFMVMFAMQFVAAQETFPYEESGDNLEDLKIKDTLTDPIKQWLTDWQGGEKFSMNLAKYLFLALVAMLVYSVVGKIPGLDTMKPFFKGTFALIVGFLSMAFIKPTEIYSLMTSYSALGFVMGGMLPFIILFFFTTDLATGSTTKSAGKRFTSKIIAMSMWALFTGFIFIKFIGAVSNNKPFALNLILFIIASIITVSMTTIFKKIRQKVGLEKKEKFTENIEKHKAVDKGKEDEFEASAGI